MMTKQSFFATLPIFRPLHVELSRVIDFIGTRTRRYWVEEQPNSNRFVKKVQY